MDTPRLAERIKEVAYLEGDFDRAVVIFERLLAMHATDGPTRLLLKRAAELRDSPPTEWNGIWTGGR